MGPAALPGPAAAGDAGGAGGHRRPDDAHLEREDEQPVQEDVGGSPGAHPQKARAGETSFRTKTERQVLSSMGTENAV